MSDTTRFEGNEPPGIGRARIVVGSVIGFILFAAAAMAVLYFLYLPFSRERPILRSQFPEPQLQAAPTADLAKLAEAQRALLSSSQWIDRESGTLSIPIDAAMREIANRGSAAYSSLPAGGDADTARPPGAVAPENRSANPGAGDLQTDRVPQ